MHIPHHFILLQRNPLYLSADMKDLGLIILVALIVWIICGLVVAFLCYSYRFHYLHRVLKFSAGLGYIFPRMVLSEYGIYF